MELLAVCTIQLSSYSVHSASEAWVSRVCWPLPSQDSEPHLRAMAKGLRGAGLS
jgi:hypothetical protein